MSLEPEAALAVAILHRAWMDARSPEPWLRRPAREFWQDTQAVAFWDDLLGLEGALARYAAQVGQAPGRGEAVPQQLALW